MEKLSFLDQSVPVNINFEQLSYFVKENKDKKYILNDVNGQFYAGELIAILGASGSGKTTLLNILSGYVRKNVKGTIGINGEKCVVDSLRRSAAYIMQNDLVQPHLTVKEEMMVVANLKIPGDLNTKNLRVKELIKMFKLEDCYVTRVEEISGGERKRLSIALELISNPSLVFIDEPTSGLDFVSTNVCVGILKELAKSGKTIICTIHQPTVSVMNQFQQVYFLAQGSCIYNGSTENILPFLSSLNLVCPITSSYSEFVIETVETQPEMICSFSGAIRNGKENYRRLENKRIRRCESERSTVRALSGKLETSFWTQFTVLLKRMMLQQMRNRTGLLLQLFTHAIIGTMFGLSFYGVGSSAKSLMSNVYFCWLVTMFFLYNPVMTHITVFPFEMEFLRKEYLNRWYDLNAYYLALCLRTIPVMVVMGFGCILVCYLLSSQPLEADRFFRFTATSLLVSITTEGLGLTIGCTFSTMEGTIIGPCIIAPIAMIPLYGFGFGAVVSSTMEIVMRLSYMRYAMVASLVALMKGRPPLDCPDDVFCYYKDPKHLMYSLGISNQSYGMEMLGLLGYAILFRILAYLVLKIRMREELTGRNSDYVTQILKLKG